MALGNCCEEASNLFVPLTTQAVITGAVTMLVSSISNPFVTATIGTISIVAAFILIDPISKACGISDENQKMIPFFGIASILPPVLSLASTALGFPVSLPLSLLVTITVTVGLFIGFNIRDNYCE